MRPPWKRLAEHMPPPVEYKTTRATPPDQVNPDDYPWLADADRIQMWRNLTKVLRAKMADLETEVERLRASLALAERAGGRPVDCGHEATLRRYDALLEQCRAEHVDRGRAGAAGRGGNA